MPTPTESKVDEAMAAWRQVLGGDRVLAGDAAQALAQCTSGTWRHVIAYLRARCTQDIVAALAVARQYGIPLYPVSTGHNWGLGSSIPVRDGCAILSLADMAEIEAFDERLGLLTVQPGVTQAQLARFLAERNLPYLVPVTGAGPDCSLLGNALERGSFMTPHADHFAAVTRLEAVLPNGEIYRGSLDDLGATCSAAPHKWGCGPYFDGLFSQGNLGIVTRMTLMLAPRPERIEAFAFTAAEDAQLEGIIDAAREILKGLPGVSTGVSMIDQHRAVAGAIAYPDEFATRGVAIPESYIQQVARERNIPAWSGYGSLYGDPGVVRAARALVRKRLAGRVQRLVFMDQRKVQWASRFLSLLPRAVSANHLDQLGQIQTALSFLQGQPNEQGLKIAYWRSGRGAAQGPLNPARDGCGLIWYLPVVPMIPEVVRAYVQMVHRVCRKHDINPLVQLNTMDALCIDGTLPILFDRNQPRERDAAHACHAELMEAGRRIGIFPYRLGVDDMAAATSTESAFWRLAAVIKSAVDPQGIVAPGRYSPPPKSSAEAR